MVCASGVDTMFVTNHFPELEERNGTGVSSNSHPIAIPKDMPAKQFAGNESNTEQLQYRKRAYVA